MEKELQDKLLELKSEMEKSLTQKAKDEIALQIKALLEGQLKTISEQIETLKGIVGKPDEATTKLINGLSEELKTLKAATPIRDVETVKELTELSVTLKALKEAADKNQTVIDAFVSRRDEKVEKNKKSFVENLGEALLEKTDDIAKFERKEIRNLVIEMKTVGDISTGNVTGGSRFGAQFAPNIIEAPNRRLHVRDLLPVAQAGPGNTFTFMKENGAGEGAIAPTAETGTKPQLDLDLVESTVNFEVIAGWVRVTRKAMNNIPGFVAFLQSRLPEKLLRVEDTQILYGDGNTPNLKGIGTSGNFTAATTTFGKMADALIDAISQLEDTNERYATGVLIRPRAYYNFFKNKASGSGEYDLPKNFIFVNGILYISGIPVFPSTAVTAGDYFVGDWQMGAQLLIQEGMRIEFFEQDSTNVRENKVTVRIEEIIALPVYGSDYFIKGTDADQS